MLKWIRMALGLTAEYVIVIDGMGYPPIRVEVWRGKDLRAACLRAARDYVGADIAPADVRCWPAGPTDV